MKKQFTETEALNFIYRRIKNNDFIKTGIGDDSALFDKNTIISVDSYVEEIHFRLSYFTKNKKTDYKKLGTRLIYGAASDIAASGGELKAVFISITIPQNFTLQNFKEIYKGIEQKVLKMGGVIAGGDITSGKHLVFSITVIGKTKKFTPRDGAKKGDRIYITGYPGLSETGRIAIEIKKEKQFPKAVKRFFNPVPPFDIVKKHLKKINSAIDLSDGLSLDLYRLLQKSKKGAILFKEKIPLHPELINLCKIKKTDPLNFALSSGEDYHLLFTSPKNIKDKKVFLIGVITEKGYFLKTENGYTKINPQGYIHKIS